MIQLTLHCPGCLLPLTLAEACAPVYITTAEPSWWTHYSIPLIKSALMCRQVSWQQAGLFSVFRAHAPSPRFARSGQSRACPADCAVCRLHSIRLTTYDESTCVRDPEISPADSEPRSVRKAAHTRTVQRPRQGRAETGIGQMSSGNGARSTVGCSSGRGVLVGWQGVGGAGGVGWVQDAQGRWGVTHAGGAQVQRRKDAGLCAAWRHADGRDGASAFPWALPGWQPLRAPCVRKHCCGRHLRSRLQGPRSRLHRRRMPPMPRTLHKTAMLGPCPRRRRGDAP